MDTELTCDWKPVEALDGWPRFRCQRCGEYVQVEGVDDIAGALSSMPACGVIRDQSNAWHAERVANAKPRVRGVGDALHSLIVKWTGQGIRAGCGCRSVIARMNAWGPDGCREHMPEIVAKVRSEAKRRGLWSVLARIPGASQPIRWIVNAAIAEIERGPTGGADDRRAAEGD